VVPILAGRFLQDPSGIFKDVRSESGLIDKRLSDRAKMAAAKADKEFSKREEKIRKTIEKRRASRSPPENDPRGLIEYLLDTEDNDIEYEVTRCR